MKRDKILRIFAIVLLVSSILKLTGVHVLLINTYEGLSTNIMTWFCPDLFTVGLYPASVQALALYMPLLWIICVGLFIYKKVKYRKHSSPPNDSGSICDGR